MSWNTIPQEQRDLYAKILTPFQYDVLRHRMNGHSFRRIGMAMNIHEATVRGHYRAALEAIRKHTEAA